MAEIRQCVVTGGRGFAARHLVEMLIRSNMWSVRIADLSPMLKIDPHEENGILGEALRSGHAQYVAADLRDKAQVVKGADAVFHMAAPDSSINNYQLHYSVNVEGTKNVIDACMDCNVKRLIYTSSPSVVFDGIHGIYNGDESIPYPSKHNDSYSATKAEAEALVIKANGKNGLLTCCIRPSSIFGPGDKLMVPSLVAAARAGKSKFIIGNGKNMYDFTYVENVAHGHVCAERVLASTNAELAAGKAYIISNMEPIKFWEFMSLILEGLGYERPSIMIPVCIMMPIAHVVEWVYKVFAPFGMSVPQLIPSRIRLLSCNRTFNCSSAKNKLGYLPIVSLEEGIQRTVESFSHLRADIHEKSPRPSKISIFLGGGKVAETLLWREKRQTLGTIFILALFYYYFIMADRTFVSSVSNLLLVAAVFLLLHCFLPSKMFGYEVQKVKAADFESSRKKISQLILLLGSIWNSAVNTANSICKGSEWTLFFKAVVLFTSLTLLGKISLQTLFGIGLPVILILLYTYDRYEEEIDSLLREACSFIGELKADFPGKLLTVNQSAP